MSREYSPEELLEYNGADDPSYVAFNGEVYDVSRSELWESGAHWQQHAAGRDLTRELRDAPHGREVFDREKVMLVGTLKGAEAGRKEAAGEEPRELSLRDLAGYTGEMEASAYVAVDGKVYDVTRSKMWKEGQHMKRHRAGGDLTGELSAAPHGREVFEREGINEVGTVREGETEEAIPGFLSVLFKRFPILRRHPHPMMVHFPMAYLFAGSIFTFLYLLGAGEVLEKIAFVMLILGAIFVPPTIGTGFLTWWVNYRARMIHQVKRKIQLSVLLSFFIILCLVLKLGGLTGPSGIGWIYSVMMLLFAPIVVLMGYYGGQLTMPYEKE